MSTAHAAALICLMRPHHWIKNGFVLVGVLFGHGWTDPNLAWQAALLFAAFCLVSSAVYVLNDVMDREADRRHPRKRSRPVAAGRIAPRHALAFALLLALAGLLLAERVSLAALAFAAGYVALNAGYSAGLREVAILDVFIIAGGFMLRILAGTVGLGIAPSQWLLLCGLMLTVFLGFAKRRAELGAAWGAGSAIEKAGLGTFDRSAEDWAAQDNMAARGALAGYTPALLDRMIWLSAGGTLLTYALYTVDNVTILTHGTDKLVYTVPFVVYGLFRYLYVLYRRGGGADPALEVPSDAHLLVVAAGWLVLVLLLIA